MKIFKNFLLLLIGFCVGAGVAILVINYIDSYKVRNENPYVLASFTSPDTSSSIKIVANTHPKWFLGGQEVHIEIGDVISTNPIYIDTHGKDFNDYSVKWDNNKATVVLNISHKEQAIYEVLFYDGVIDVKLVSV